MESNNRSQDGAGDFIQPRSPSPSPSPLPAPPPLGDEVPGDCDNHDKNEGVNGITRKARTVMECLHRFCRECIDKSMRIWNNECPSCRKHRASHHSLGDDPNIDALIDERLYLEAPPDSNPPSHKFNMIAATSVFNKNIAQILDSQIEDIEDELEERSRQQIEEASRKEIEDTNLVAAKLVGSSDAKMDKTTYIAPPPLETPSQLKLAAGSAAFVEESKMREKIAEELAGLDSETRKICHALVRRADEMRKYLESHGYILTSDEDETRGEYVFKDREASDKECLAFFKGLRLNSAKSFSNHEAELRKIIDKLSTEVKSLTRQTIDQAKYLQDSMTYAQLEKGSFFFQVSKSSRRWLLQAFRRGGNFQTWRWKMFLKVASMLESVCASSP